MSLLEIKDLTVEYHTKAGVFCAVQCLDFDLDKGKSLGFVGESGCGKTTAMLAVMRLLPDAGRIVTGQVLLDGVDILSLPLPELRQVRWKKISMIFQGAMNALNPVRTVGDQIAEAIELHRPELGPAHARQAARGLLSAVGIPPDRADDHPHQFSGGMRQRAMIALALACDPALVVADEPTTALDVMIQAQVMDVLSRLRRELGMALVLITHDLGVVAEICDRVIVMYGGVIVEQGSLVDVFEDPRHPYTRLLLEAFPDLEHPERRLSSIPGSPPRLDELPPGCRFAPRCPAAFDRCHAQRPLKTRIGAGRTVACFLVEDAHA